MGQDPRCLQDNSKNDNFQNFVILVQKSQFANIGNHVFAPLHWNFGEGNGG